MYVFYDVFICDKTLCKAWLSLFRYLLASEAITFTKMYRICQKEINFTLKEKGETARIGML